MVCCIGVTKFLIVRTAIGIAWVADAPYRWYMLFTELNVRLQRRLQPTLCALGLWNSSMSVFQLFCKLTKFLSTKRTCILCLASLNSTESSETALVVPFFKLLQIFFGLTVRSHCCKVLMRKALQCVILVTEIHIGIDVFQHHITGATETLKIIMLLNSKPLKCCLISNENLVSRHNEQHVLLFYVLDTGRFEFTVLTKAMFIKKN